MFSEEQKFFLFSQNTEAPVMCSFPVAALRKVSQTSLSKATEMYSLTLLGLEVQNPGVSRATLSPRALGENLPHAFLLASGVASMPRLVDTSLRSLRSSSRGHHLPSVYGCPLIRTLVIWDSEPTLLQGDLIFPLLICTFSSA